MEESQRRPDKNESPKAPSLKKNKRMPLAATWMDGEILIRGEVHQTEKDKHCMISLVCGIENMTQGDLSRKQKQTHRCREQTCGCRGSGGRTGRLGSAGANGVYGIRLTTGPCSRAQGTSVSIRSLSIMEKNLKKNLCVCVYATKPLC